MKNLKKTRGWLVMAAALTLGLSACSSSEDSIIEQPANPTEKTYTMTVTASKGEDNALARAIAAAGGNGETRALIYDASTKTLNAEWKAGEKVDVYTWTSVHTKVGTLTAQGDGATATLSGTVTFSGQPTLDLSHGSIGWSYVGQKGTLEDLAENFDYAKARLTWDKYNISDGVIIPKTNPVSFINQQAIVKFNLKDANGHAITAKSLKFMKMGSQNFTMTQDNITGFTYEDESFTVTRDDASSEFFVAFHAISDFDLLIDATGGDSDYCFNKKGVTFESNKFYEVAVKMNTVTVNLSEVTAAGLTEQYGSPTLTLVDGDVVTGTLDGSTEEGKVKIQIADGATVTLHNATINGHHYGVGSQDTECIWAGITCLGDATIVLEGENSVTNFNRNYPAILAAHNASGDEYTLTIRGDGKLTATNNNWGAGIGGGSFISCGNICIEGGDITVTANYNSAGIGGGRDTSCGNITINGGTVMATVSEFGAGIGSGKTGGSCGDITITGGTVTATGGKWGAGIGSGEKASCGNITITGGTVTATGAEWGAGIGSGDNASCGNITISGGTVTATGGNRAAGIGCGGVEYGFSSCGDIWIGSDYDKDFSVTAIKDKSALRPIGHSNGNGNRNSCGNIIFGSYYDTRIYNTAQNDPNDYKLSGEYWSGVNFEETTTLPDGVEDNDENRREYKNNNWKVWRKRIR